MNKSTIEILICIIIIIIFFILLSYLSNNRSFYGGWLFTSDSNYGLDDEQKIFKSSDTPLNILRLASAPLHIGTGLYDQTSGEWDVTDAYIKRKNETILARYSSTKPLTSIPKQIPKDVGYKKPLTDPDADIDITDQIFMTGTYSKSNDYRKYIHKITDLDRVVHTASVADNQHTLISSGIVDDEKSYSESQSTGEKILYQVDYNSKDIDDYGYSFGTSGIRYIQCDLTKESEYSKLINLKTHIGGNIMGYDLIVLDHPGAYDYLTITCAFHVINSGILKSPGLYIAELPQHINFDNDEALKRLKSKVSTLREYSINIYDNIYDSNIKSWVQTNIPKLATEVDAVGPFINSRQIVIRPCNIYSILNLPIYVTMFIYGRLSVKTNNLLEMPVLIITRN